MRWLGVRGFDAIKLHGFQRLRLSLRLLLQSINGLSLLDDDLIELLDLMFEMSGVRFKSFQPL